MPFVFLWNNGGAWRLMAKFLMLPILVDLCHPNVLSTLTHSHYPIFHTSGFVLIVIQSLLVFSINFGIFLKWELTSCYTDQIVLLLRQTSSRVLLTEPFCLLPWVKFTVSFLLPPHEKIATRTFRRHSLSLQSNNFSRLTFPFRFLLPVQARSNVDSFPLNRRFIFRFPLIWTQSTGVYSFQSDDWIRVTMNVLVVSGDLPPIEAVTVDTVKADAKNGRVFLVIVCLE